MKVNMRDLDVEISCGNNGVTFDIYNNDGTFAGKLRLGKATVEWCKGKTRMGNGHRFSLREFLDYLDHAGTTQKAKLKPKKP